MTQEEFASLLQSVTERAKQFALLYIDECLPADNIYDIQLNVSTDSSVLTQFDLYPEDNNKIVVGADTDIVINTLLRKGKIPVWIDISVEAIRENKTVLKLQCAGRYSDDNDQFYYTKNSSGPFGVKSPKLPINYQEGIRFKLQ